MQPDDEPRDAESMTEAYDRRGRDGQLGAVRRPPLAPRRSAGVIEWLEDEGTGTAAVNYRLRDWLISRQRYWGTPIPIVHCADGGEVAVPDDQLPVELPPRDVDLPPKGHVAAGAATTDWVNTTCPRAGAGHARHRHDGHVRGLVVVLPAVLLAGDEDGPFGPRTPRASGCRSTSTSGACEHAILHLLYSRFFTKVLHDMGLVDFVEPFSAPAEPGPGDHGRLGR